MSLDLCSHPNLQALEPAFRDRFEKLAKPLTLGAKKTVLKEGHPASHVYFLLSGGVRVFHRRAHREVLVKLFKAPAMFGEMEVVAGIPFLEHVTTLERSQLMLVPAPLFLRTLDASNIFSAAVVRDLSRRLCIATVNERSLVFDSIASRAISVLLDYAEAFGEPSDAGVRINYPLSQEFLAKECGGSRRMLADVLASLTRDRLLRKAKGRYELPQPDALRARIDRTLGVHYRLR